MITIKHEDDELFKYTIQGLDVYKAYCRNLSEVVMFLITTSSYIRTTAKNFKIQELDTNNNVVSECVGTWPVKENVS